MAHGGHKHSPRANKVENRIWKRQGGKQADVLRFPVERIRAHDGNLVPTMDGQDYEETFSRITDRYREAQPITELVTEEIDRSERQFEGLFEGQELYRAPDEDDHRIYARKTTEHCQVVYSHLDNLTGQLNPLLTLTPSVAGTIPLEKQFSRAKVKELLTNHYLDKVKFRQDTLSRWRWNFLKHPSAYLRVTYKTDQNRPDIKIDVIDRAALYIDPSITTGDIKDAGWVIERDWITESHALEMIDGGFYHLPQGITGKGGFGGRGNGDEIVARITGRLHNFPISVGVDGDREIERWQYWQAAKNGHGHAYGVILGGIGGELVLYGSNPFPYKGIPYRGKSYLRHPYRPDGISLAMQFRSIQEVTNTFLNIRIDDVLENVKRRIFVLGQLFDEQTKKDHDDDSKFVRFNQAFGERILEKGMSFNDFFHEMDNGDSTQHLLTDLQLFNNEGKETTNISDVFRGQNPQSGATLGQVQEQLFRALGVFSPIFMQEMTMIEEIGEIIVTYFEDEEFFGEDRIAQIIGPNRYKDVVQGFHTDDTSGVSVRSVSADEMDVDVTIDVTNQATAKASRTMELSMTLGMLEQLRHHPELMKEAMEEINFPVLLMRILQNSGQDIEAITYTPDQKKKRAQEKEQEKQKAIEEQMKLAQSAEQLKTQSLAALEQQKVKGQMALHQAQESADLQSSMAQIVAKDLASHRSKMEEDRFAHEARLAEDRQKFLHSIELMIKEARLEAVQPTSSVGHGNNINQ